MDMAQWRKVRLDERTDRLNFGPDEAFGKRQCYEGATIVFTFEEQEKAAKGDGTNCMFTVIE